MDGISGLKWKWNWEMGGGISERELVGKGKCLAVYKENLNRSRLECVFVLLKRELSRTFSILFEIDAW